MISNSELKDIDTLLFDVDGTLTDGKVAWDSNGAKVKFFDIKDIHWLKLARRAGLKTGVISGQDGRDIGDFITETGMDIAVFNAKDKIAAFENLVTSGQIDPAHTLYAGDDVVDLPLLKRVKAAVAVANAVPELDEAAHWRTRNPGGNGAAMEIIRKVLEANESYNKIMERYRK